MDKKHFHGYNLASSVTDDMIAVQTTDPYGEVITHTIALRDQIVRNSLIKLGWTPPDERRDNYKVFQDVFGPAILEPIGKHEVSAGTELTIRRCWERARAAGLKDIK